jgi:transcription initiation factor TFIIB
MGLEEHIPSKDNGGSKADKECPDCSGTRFVEDDVRAEIICFKCGLVIEEKLIDDGPSNVFSNEDWDKQTTGPASNIMIHDKGLSTEIGWKNRDYNNKRLPKKRGAQVYRMRQWQNRIRFSNSTERNIMVASKEITTIGAKLNLPESIKESAMVIYRLAANKSLVRGRSIEAVVAFSIYAACRLADNPRSLDEIAEYSDQNRKQIGRTYRFLKRKLKVKLNQTKPQDYVDRLCSELGLSRETKFYSLDIIAKATEAGLVSGRGPLGIAASSTYLASRIYGEKRTQKEIAQITGVTEVTIRNRYKEMIKKLNIDLPE